MKSKMKINILRILFIISLIISLLLISDTYAKYQEQVNTSYKSTIKRWKLIVNNEIIREKESLTQVVEPILKNNLYVADDVIAPGRNGYFDMDINFSQVDVPFSVEFFLEQNETSENYNNLPDFQFYGYYVERNDTFYYNLPEEYQQVEYIESTGTQYIDTMVIADSDTVETTIKFATDKIDSTMSFGGAENTQTEDIAKMYQMLPYLENNIMSFNVGQNSKVYSQEITASEFYKVTQKYTDSNTEDDTTGGTLNVSVNDELKFSDTFTGTIKNNRNIWLFANNNEANDNKFSSIKIKEFKYSKDNYIALELVPCYRISDGVIGMYDTITGTFFTNSGTGTFLKGEDVKKVVIDPTLEEYKNLADEEKIENVKAYVRWVDGDGTTESPVDILNNTEDTAFVIDEKNIDVKYKATAIFEQYIEE